MLRVAVLDQLAAGGAGGALFPLSPDSKAMPIPSTPGAISGLNMANRLLPIKGSRAAPCWAPIGTLAKRPRFPYLAPAIRAGGRSSGVEHNLAKVGVEGSNPFARSRFLPDIRGLGRPPTRRSLAAPTSLGKTARLTDAATVEPCLRRRSSPAIFLDTQPGLKHDPELTEARDPELSLSPQRARLGALRGSGPRYRPRADPLPRTPSGRGWTGGFAVALHGLRDPGRRASEEGRHSRRSAPLAARRGAISTCRVPARRDATSSFLCAISSTPTSSAISLSPHPLKRLSHGWRSSPMRTFSSRR